MKICIENCNNIVHGNIDIEKNKLNIKFGINGTGKSTLANAIQFKIKSDEELKNLLPFKLRKKNPENLEPKVNISDEINHVSIFNEEYVNQFLFKQDELINNSFEIFIKTPEYIKKEENIEKELEEIKKVFSDNKELEEIISDLKELSDYFKFSKTGKINKASKGAKSLNEGNKIENIPDNIIEYKSFIQDEKCVEWLGWQSQGEKFSAGHENCPYCVSATDKAKKEKIKAVSEEYDKNLIKNLKGLISVIKNLGDYFSDNANDTLKIIVTQKNGLEPEQESFLKAAQSQINDLVEKLEKMKELSFSDFKNTKNIEEILSQLKINLTSSFNYLDSEKTNEIVGNLNASLNSTLTKITNLQRVIGIQKTEIKNSITTHQKNINQFLKNAGYKYQVIIEDETTEYKMKLQHIDLTENIQGGRQYLSFGEKNAFALVLFMHEALSKNTDLIILDDPISSFDKNKKYAILQMLFREQKSFKGKTVLMLTHDFEPIIDTVKALAGKFGTYTMATFLENNNEIITEKEIKKDDILTFSQICEKIRLDENINIISKLIYLRRSFEILNDKGDEYQILSDLLHRRIEEDAKINRKKFNTSFNNGKKEIKKLVSSFDYEKLLKIVTDKQKLKEIYNSVENSYEKLQIFRIINEDFSNPDNFSDVMKKFINETYHIENDFIHQLDPKKYNLVPEFIIKECDDYILKL